MPGPIIHSGKVAVAVSVAYLLFSILAIREALGPRVVSASEEPIVRGIAYLFCVYFFIEIQRGAGNALEKLATLSSAAAFLVELAYLVLGNVYTSLSFLAVFLWMCAVLIAMSTVGFIGRAIQLYRRDCEI